MFCPAKQKVHDRESWLDYRNYLLLTAIIKIGRRLQVFEDQILLFPRVCEVCKEAEASRMIDCSVCRSVFYCSDEHRSQDAERHMKWCQNYLLCIQCDVLEAKEGVPDLSFPNIVDNQYTKLPATIRDHITSEILFDASVGRKEIIDEKDLDQTHITLLSERLSYPLSLLYSLQELEIGPDRQSVNQISELRVHVVGAKSTVELLGIIRWEYMVHRLPSLKKLHIVFVGPELFTASGLSDELPDNHCLDDSLMTRCKDCERKDRSIIYEMCQMLYHEYVKASCFTSPDVIVAFNCGFHEFQDEDKDTWPESLSVMVKNPDVPLIFTSYTQSEAKKDLVAVEKVDEIEVSLPTSLNPYRSMRPTRDISREDDCDMYFENQFITCVRGKMLS